MTIVTANKNADNKKNAPVKFSFVAYFVKMMKGNFI